MIRELIDTHVMDLLWGLWIHMSQLFYVFINDAKMIALIAMVLYFSYKGWSMLVGDERLEIMPLLRPFALSLVIMFWGFFVDIVTFPMDYFTRKAKWEFNKRAANVDAAQVKRLTLLTDFSQEVMGRVSDMQELEDAEEKKWYEFVEVLGIDLDDLFNLFESAYIWIHAQIKFITFQIFEFIAVTFFQVCCYLVFFIQIIFGGILAIFGPISFALSIFPAFRDAYIHWIARFISVALYSAIAYIILCIVLVFAEYAILQEIDMLTQLTKPGNDAILMAWVTAYDGGLNLFVICMLIGGVVLLATPVISTWIIRTSGIGHALNAASRGAQGVVGGATKLASGMA